MKELTIRAIFKSFEYLAYTILFIGCLIFVKGNWDEYKSQATSYTFSTKNVNSITSPTIVICFQPIAKRSYLSKYGLVPEDFVTNDLLEIDNYTEFSKPWQDIFHEGSYRIGNDFKISLCLRDNSFSIE